MMLASAATLLTVGASPGPPLAARWAVGGILLTITATITGRRAARRRAGEMRLRAEIQERERLQRELEHLADHDPLTGVANRRRLEQDLARELSRARRDGTPLCVATIDLDDLKTHNDTYGHAAGDRLLQHVAHTWSLALRSTDILARTGGDEFVIVFPDCTLDMAERLVDDLSQAVAPMCECSAGAALWDGHESADDLQVRADLAMYAAKARARELTVATTSRRKGDRPELAALATQAG
jgi:diguanylate cyclase (GGDEF)-like protein